MKTLDQYSGMPQMGAAFLGWQQKITLVKIVQSIVNGFNVDAESSVSFMGVIQPLKSRDIALKPEGQRAWDWLQIHDFSGVQNLNNNDRILYNSKRYKVMNVKDYSLDNYIEYHVIADYI